MRQLIEWFRIQLFHNFISIRLKFVFSITVVILFFGGISLIITYNFVVHLSENELSRKAALVAQTLKDQLSDLVLVNDLAMTNSLIREMKKDDKDILYILIREKNGRIIGHTFENDSIPAFLNNLPVDTGITLLFDKKNDLYILQTSREFNYQDIGSVVVGLDESITVNRGRQIITLLVAVFFMLLFCVGIAVVLLSYFILHPVNQIIRGLESFVPGRKIPEFRIVFNDEMKLLGMKFLDMTERLSHMVNESKATQLKMIETEKLASIGTLASGVAHEINNPIAGIEICAHRLQKSQTADSKHIEYVKLIIEAADHIKTIVRSLLAYARQPDQKIEQVDLCAVAKFALKLLHYRLQKKEIAVNEYLPGYPCFVLGIRAQLVQVIVNGIINAIDASFVNGNITLQIYESGSNYNIDIIDNGVGIESSVAGKVFDPFFTTKGSQGTGLGLYVSYNIVTAHNGSIALEPLDGRGARLRIQLPTYEESLKTSSGFTDNTEQMKGIWKFSGTGV